MPKGMLIALAMFVLGLQGAQWKLVRTIPGPATGVYADALKNIYIQRSGTIEKYDNAGKMLTQYSNKLIGQDVQVDVTNPLKVLLYSPDQMKVIFLDSRLGELRDPVSLLDEGYGQVTLAATSHSNGFWIYDAINFQLVRYDQYLEREQASPNIAQLLRLEFYPNHMMEVNNRVYLNDPEHGVFVFDIFGNYLKRLPLKELPRLSIANERLFYARGDALYATHLTTLEEEVVSLPFAGGKAFDIGKSVAVTAGEKEVRIFAAKQ